MHVDSEMGSYLLCHFDHRRRIRIYRRVGRVSGYRTRAVLRLRRDLPDFADPRVHDIQSVAMLGIATIPPAQW